MNQLPVLIRKATKILLREGPTSLLSRIIETLKIGRRNRLQHAAYAEIDRIAKCDITNAEKFLLIYQKRLWLKAMPHLNPERALSGHGSTQLSTQVLRSNLQNFLIETRVTKFFDAPCGDFNWMRNIDFPNNCMYIGGDIVSTLIDSLQKKYGGGYSKNGKMTLRQFITFDITKDDFPIADCWLCKDCLQHLSNSDILLALNNFRRSQVKFALISNHVDVCSNIDIETGQFRHVDLTRAPFNLPPPQQTLADAPFDNEPRYIGVWRREDLG